MHFKFVHAADLHLDTPFKGISTDSPVGGLFPQATFRALSRLVDLCLRERADFLLLAGDLFDLREQSIRARLALREQLSRLHQAQISTFIVHGNHDPLDSDRGYVELPCSVKEFGSSWEEVPFVREGQLLARIQGVSYPQERVADNLALLFNRQGCEFTIGLLHANVGGHPAHANYAPCSLEDLSSRQLDYWALGHVHTRAEYPLSGGGIAVYPGNPQGRHIREAGERGCFLVEVSEGQAHPRFVPLDSIRWHLLELDLDRHDRFDELEDEIRREVDARCLGGFDAHAIRLVLGGRGPLHRELSRPGALASLEERLGELLIGHSPPVVLESVRDETQSELDLDALLRAGGLGAAIISSARSAQKERSDFQALWTEAELPRLEGALRRASLTVPEDHQLFLRRALWRAVDLLQDEEDED